MNDNLKERLTDMSVLASTRTPADALQYIEELEAKLAKATDVALRLYYGAGVVTDDMHATLAELTGGKDE